MNVGDYYGNVPIVGGVVISIPVVGCPWKLDDCSCGVFVQFFVVTYYGSKLEVDKLEEHSLYVIVPYIKHPCYVRPP